MKIISVLVEPLECGCGDSQRSDGVPKSQNGDGYVLGSTLPERGGRQGVGAIVKIAIVALRIVDRLVGRIEDHISEALEIF